MTLDPDTDLSFTCDLKAPRALIWECWTTPEHIMAFFVPKPHQVTACDLDLRIGGRFNSTFLVEGDEMHNRGVFLEIVPQRRLVFTDAFTEGWKPAPDPFLTSIVLLEDGKGGGTRYTAIARHRSPEARKRHEDMGFFGGWRMVAEQADALALELAGR